MTLKELSDKFDHWRANKKSKGERIPQHLWNELFALEAQGCSIHHICKTLSLSGTQVTRQRAYHTKNGVEQSTHFIDITSKMLPASSTDDHTVQCELKLNLHDKTLNLTLPVHQLKHILPSLQGLLQ